MMALITSFVRTAVLAVTTAVPLVTTAILTITSFVRTAVLAVTTAVPLVTTAILTVPPISASAGQKSFDLNVGDEMGKISSRGRQHEKVLAGQRRELQSIASEIGDIQKKIEELPDELDPWERGARNRELVARLTQRKAGYVVAARRMIKGSEKVIGANVKSLRKLWQQLANTPIALEDEAKAVEELEELKAGARHVYASFEQLAELVRANPEDPEFHRRFRQMNALIAGLDRRVGVAKRRTASDRASTRRETRTKYMRVLENAISDLTSTHISLQNDKLVLDNIEADLEQASEIGIVISAGGAAHMSMRPFRGADGEPSSHMPGLPSIADSSAEMSEQVANMPQPEDQMMSELPTYGDPSMTLHQPRNF